MITRILLLLLLTVPWPAAAQFVVEDREVLEFDRPEAWAMAYLGSTTLFTGFATPRRRATGEWQVGAELSQIPHVSESRRRVGFNGTKLEDLNKSPAFGRLRFWLGLPGDVSLEIGWSPSFEIGGARNHDMFGIALERPLLEHGPWRWGARAFAHRGSVQGDFTCDRETAAEPPGSPANPFGCRAASRDRFTLKHYGLQTSIARAVSGGRGEAYFGLAHTRLEARTQVNAQVFSVIDRSLLLTQGEVTSVSLGVSRQLSRGIELLAEASWTPLSVRRPPQFRTNSDDLVHARLMLRWGRS